MQDTKDVVPKQEGRVTRQPTGGSSWAAVWPQGPPDPGSAEVLRTCFLRLRSHRKICYWLCAL